MNLIALLNTQHIYTWVCICLFVFHDKAKRTQQGNLLTFMSHHNHLQNYTYKIPLQYLEQTLASIS